MKKATFLRKMLWLLLIPFLTTSCEDKMDEHYEVPDWVAGSAWEVLQSGEHGNYSMFLEGAELAGFKPLLKGKSIVTVMAPDDQAFGAYLQQHGYASVKDIPTDELKKVIGFHLVYYSYTTESFINFRPNGSMETDEEREKNAGLYYKHRTRSSDAPTWETTADNKSVLVYHLERFLPVFSYRYFQSKKIDAKASYEYFYPGSTWTGDKGFNISNASVKNYEIAANNGYIYTIDRVIEPLETIYTQLKNNDNYSTFLDLYDTSAAYVFDDELTKSYGANYGVDSLYLYKHDTATDGTGLPNIACEWPVSSYNLFELLSRASYTIFAPTNTAIEKFYNDFWKAGGYTSLQDVDKIAMNQLIYSFMWGGDMLFPQEIEKMISDKELNINIDPSTIQDRYICVNGTLYGMNELKTPTDLASIIGPVYQYKNARSYLYALEGSGIKGGLTSQESNYTMFIPTAEQFEYSGITTAYSTKSLTKDTENGPQEISSSEKQGIVYMHTANLAQSQDSELPKEGSKVIPTMSSWNYWFVHNGKITCNAFFNRQLNPEYQNDIYCNFTKTTEKNNGTVYSFDSPELFASETEKLTASMAICADKRYVYYNFVQLMKKAGMVAGENLINLLGVDRFIVFIPTNEAIQKALEENRIPGLTDASFDADGNLNVEGEVNIDVLKEYLNSYFICNTGNALVDYPYIGSAMKSGAYTTQSSTTLIYEDNGKELTIQPENKNKCQVIADYNYFPFAFEDGCFHLINDTF